MRRFANELLAPRKRPFDYPVFKGSMLWCMTRDCVKYLRARLLEDRAYWRFFRFVHAPDEILIHTVLKDSRFTASIFQDSERCPLDPCRHALHYIDWSGSRGGSPKVLVASDWEKIVASGALFVRKIDPIESRELIKKIEVDVFHTGTER
jgi:hypothetical protein